MPLYIGSEIAISEIKATKKSCEGAKARYFGIDASRRPLGVRERKCGIPSEWIQKNVMVGKRHGCGSTWMERRMQIEELDSQR
jgi:hypothetical protein